MYSGQNDRIDPYLQNSQNYTFIDNPNLRNSHQIPSSNLILPDGKQNLRNSYAPTQYPSSGPLRNDQNLAVSPYRHPLNYSFVKNDETSSNSKSLLKDKIINAPLSDKIDFDREADIKLAERQKYRYKFNLLSEDLDYLVKLKRFQNGGPEQQHNMDDFRRYQNLNNDDSKFVKDQKRDMYLKYNNLYNDDMHYHKDKEISQKMTKQEELKALNEKIEYANSLEKQKLMNQRQLLKDVKHSDLENYYRRKSVFEY